MGYTFVIAPSPKRFRTHAIVRFRHGILSSLRFFVVGHRCCGLWPSSTSSGGGRTFFWIWVILFHRIGALVYIVVEVIPDAGLLREFVSSLSAAAADSGTGAHHPRQSFGGKLRRTGAAVSRRRQLRAGAGKFRQGDFVADRPRRSVLPAGSCGGRTGRFRGGCAGPGARRHSDPDYDFHRAKGLLAWAYAQTGQAEKADAMFREATRISTISETYYHYALFLQSQGRAAEAREWSQKILDKKPTMPGYLRRRERPWFRKASALLGRLPAT